MPVLINTDSGDAESLNTPDEALKAGTHEIPLVSPEGDFGSAPIASVKDLLKQGYTQPSSEQLTHALNQAKYGSAKQQAIGTLEQVGRGAFGPIPTMVEKAAGVKEEDIRGREEQQSTMQKMLGQGAGLIGSSFIPGGQGKVLARVGEAGAELLGLGEATSTLAKVGSIAAKAGIENAAYQAGDEATKVVLHDPDQTASSAAMNVGLAGLIGAGVGGVGAGVVSPLWSATVGPKVENILRLVANRANGETLPVSQGLDAVFNHLEKNGIEIAPEIRAGFSENPIAQNYFHELVASGTNTGDAINQTLEKFQGDLKEQMASLFRSKEPMTAFEAGEKAKELITDQANKLNEGISAKYAEVMPQLEAIQVPKIERSKFVEALLQKGAESFGKDSSFYKLYEEIGDRINSRDSVRLLKQLGSEIGTDAKEAWRVGAYNKAKALTEINNSLKEFQDNQIIASGKALAKQGVPEAAGLAEKLVADKKIADKSYREFVEKLGDLSAAGKLGKVGTHGELLNALEKIPSAKLADKLFDPKNIEGLNFLKKEFPEVFAQIMQAKKTSMLEAASTKGELMHNQLLGAVNKLPKEVKNMMFNPEEQELFNASGSVLRQSARKLNPSGTAKGIDKLFDLMPAGVGGATSFLLGHGAIPGYIAGYMAKFLGRDAPEAAKMSLLKFLGSSAPIDGTAWKAAGDYIAHALRGEALLVKATKAAVKSGQEVLPKSQLPDQKTRDKLDKKLKELQADSSPMLDVGGKVAHYMPDHAGAMANISMNAVNYLNQIRPKQVKLSPLDSDIEPPRTHIANYNRALDIAQQPLVLMQSIQDGNLTPMDLTHLHSLYPSVYNRMAIGLTDAMVNRTADEEPIKYKQRISMSLFLAQPLDSTMTPMGILGAQPQPSQASQDQQPKMSSGQPSQVTQKAMSNIAKGNATPGQQREMIKSGSAKA